MGVRGAAIATVIGQLLGMLVIAGFLFLREHPVKISLRKFRFSKPILMDIYSVGFPSMLMQAIPSFVTVFSQCDSHRILGNSRFRSRRLFPDSVLRLYAGLRTESGFYADHGI